jgi:hypothetical protein
MQQADADNEERHENHRLNIRPHERRQDWASRRFQYHYRPVVTTIAKGGNATPSLRSVIGGDVRLFTRNIRDNLPNDWLHDRKVPHLVRENLVRQPQVTTRTHSAPPGTTRRRATRPTIRDTRLLQATRATRDSRPADVSARTSTITDEAVSKRQRRQG